MNPRTHPATWALVLLVLALAGVAPAASAQVDGVRSVLFDLFEYPDVERIEYETGCDGASFSHDAQQDAFTFTEEQGATTPLTAPARGCGEARWRVEVPAGTDHLHVRFLADRAASGPTGVFTPTFVQELRIQDVNGASLAVYPYFRTDADPAEEVYQDMVNYPVPAGTRFVDIVWWFADEAPRSGGTPIDAAVGWSATVRAPQIEFSGIPVLDADVRQEDRRSGTIAVADTTVVAPVPRDLLQRYDVVVRVAVHEDLALQEVVTPTGRVVKDSVTRNITNRHDAHQPLVVHGKDVLEVYLPAGMVADDGPGTYTLFFRGVADLRILPALVPVAAALLLLPLPFAVAAVVGARTFEREAFGGFRRSAKMLAVAVMVAVAYYVVVVASAFVGRRLELMAVWPIEPDGLFLYIQVVVAIVAFLMLWLVARELAKLTRPAEVRP